MLAKKTFLILSVIIIIFVSSRDDLCTGQLAEFSIDKASPEYLVPFSSADVIFRTGLGVFIPATWLGLEPNDELDALSQGLDALVPAGSDSWVPFFFSVTRNTIGLPGSAVRAEAIPPGNGAAGDIFVCVLFANGSGAGSVRLVEDATQHNLTPLPEPQSDLDAMQTIIGSNLRDQCDYFEYFSVDVNTAQRLTGVNLLCSPADILCQANPRPGAPLPFVWADANTLGLDVNDNIDALAIDERLNFIQGGVRGQLDPYDIIYVSLAPGSPTLLGPDGLPDTDDDISAADILQVKPGPLQIICPCNTLGLQFGDDLNAMMAWDPGKAQNGSPAIPCDWGESVKPNVVFRWTPGMYAAKHDVYLSTNFNDVSDGNRANQLSLVSQDQDANTYDPPGLLEFSTTYYWRIDEVNDPNIWKGEIWQFTTSPINLYGDNRINFEDYAVLAAHWRFLCAEPNWCEGADIDGDGTVNFYDLRILAQYWLEWVTL